MIIYDDYKQQIKSGDLLAWSCPKVRDLRSLELKLIQSATQSQFDHVGIAWVEGNRVLYIEAAPPEVKISVLSHWVPFYHVPMNIEWQQEYLEYLFDRLGEPYSIWEAFISYFGSPNPDKQWQCAELVNHFYKKIGLKKDFGYTPKSVVEAALEYSGSGLIKVNS